MRYDQVDPKLFIKNRSKISKEINSKSIVIIVSNDEFPRNGNLNYPFRQNSDFFYLTGMEQAKSMLCLFPDHPDENQREILFIIKPDEHLTTWFGEKYNKKEAGRITGITTIKWQHEFDAALKDLIPQADNIYLNTPENNQTFTEIADSSQRFAKKLQAEFPLHNYKRLAPIISALRTIKEPQEVDLMKRACEITEKAFYRVLRSVKPGIMEYEVEAEIIHEFVRNGANGHAYDPIIASGANACILHYNDNDKECKDGDLLLMDFGAEYANYAADCSRTIPVNGRFSPRQRKCYLAVLNVFKKAKEMMVPGTTIQEINTGVNKLIESELIKLGLFTLNDVKNQDSEKPLYMKYYMHGTSHFIGLDVHDTGKKTTKLKKGMVLTCEPGIYIKDEALGVRIENDILVDNPPIDLMSSIPVEPDDIERLMNQVKVKK